MSGVETELPRYRPSGRFDGAGLWRTSLWLLGLGVAVALGYQWLHAWLENPLFHGLLAVVAALLVGVSVDVALNRGACRNRRVAFGVALGLSLAVLAASYLWGWFLARQTALAPERGAALSLAEWLACRQSSSCMRDLMGESGSSNGSFIGLAWGAEALLFVGSALYFAWARMAEPFCETCGKWMPSRTLRVNGVGRAEALGRLRRGELSGVVMLGANGAEGYTLVYHCAACPGCERTLLSLREEKRVAEGKTVTTLRTPVVELLELPAPEGQKLRERVTPSSKAA